MLSPDAAVVAARYNAHHGDLTIPELLMSQDLFPGLALPPPSPERAQAVYDFQRADLSSDLSDDGKLGPLTWRTMQEAARWLERPGRLFDVRHDLVEASLLFSDFKLPKPEAHPLWAAQLNALGITHVVVGLNSVQHIKETPGYAQDRWVPLYSPERVASAARALSRYDIKLGGMAWMSASKQLIDGMMDWVEQVQEACFDAGAPLWAFIPDAEEDWNFAELDHLALVRHFKQRAFQIPIAWLCTFVYHMHRAVRPLILGCPDGAMSQLYAHRNASRPGTLGDNFLPGLLQVRGEDLMDGWEELSKAGIPHWHLLPLYGQTYKGVRPDQAIRAQAATSLGLGVTRIGWWSEANLRRSPHAQELRRVIASFSPRRRDWS